MRVQQGPIAESEYHERLARARLSLAGAGLAACLVMAPENLFYLFGYDSWVALNGPQAAIVTPRGDAPTLIVRDVDVPLARESALVGDIRSYSLKNSDFAALVADVLADKGVRTGAVGAELQAPALPHAAGLKLAEALAPSRLVDATRLIGDLRLVKSAAEIALIEQAGAVAQEGLAALREGLKPGLSEIALAAEIEAALRRAGSDYWAIPTELASGPRTPGGHATPGDRVLQPGDLVHAEFAGVRRRYHAVAIQTLALGEPGARARELYGLALDSLRAGLAAARPGAQAPDLEEASLEPLAARGLERAAMMRFGYGIGIAYPPLWLETLRTAPGFDRPLQPGMTLVLHACLELAEEGLGVIIGGTWLVEESGLRLLAGAGDVDLEVV